MTAAALTYLERRKIEGAVLAPMVQALARAIGKERTSEIVLEVIAELVRGDEKRWADQFGSTLDGLRKVGDVWSEGGAMKIESVPGTANQLNFNVTKCGYAELYKEWGLADLGLLFHCSRDFSMVRGFGSDISLSRTKTIMEGNSICDFRFEATYDK
jgi:hypothetical protein